MSFELTTWIEDIVLRLKADAVYQGRTYTQAVLLKLDTGQVIRVEDFRIMTKEGRLGKKEQQPSFLRLCSALGCWFILVRVI